MRHWGTRGGLPCVVLLLKGKSATRFGPCVLAHLRLGACGPASCPGKLRFGTCALINYVLVSAPRYPFLPWVSLTASCRGPIAAIYNVNGIALRLTVCGCTYGVMGRHPVMMLVLKP